MDMTNSAREAHKREAEYAETVSRIWREATDEVRKESVDRERRAVRTRKLPFGFTDKR